MLVCLYWTHHPAQQGIYTADKLHHTKFKTGVTWISVGPTLEKHKSCICTTTDTVTSIMTLSVTDKTISFKTVYSHMICCCRLVLASHASGRRSWTGQADTSCRRSGGTAAVWALYCESSTCRWDKCPWAQRCPAVSASPPRLANFPPRFPRWWQCHRWHFRHFHPFFFSFCCPPINVALRLKTKAKPIISLRLN